MKKNLILLFALIAIILNSCTSEDELSALNTSKAIEETIESLVDELILPIEGDRDTLKRPFVTKSTSYYDIKKEIDQLDNIPIYLQVKGNSSNKQFVNATKKGAELTMDTYRGNTNQQFFIKVLPATTGIPYLIYSKQTNTPIRIGAYTNKPDVKILYASQDASGSLFGASWDFKKGEYSANSFAIENQDYPQQGSSGAWWDIYYSVVTVNNAKISFSKYNKSPQQEFEIIPVEKFQIQEIRFNIDASSVLTKMPDIVLLDKYTNNGSVDQTHKFTLTETITETSNYNRKTSYNISTSTEVKAKVPFIASGKITTSTSFGQEYTYGKSESSTRTISREYTINVPAKRRAEIALTLFKYNMDVEYTAVCRGLTSGRIINITGRWTGVNVQETDAVLDLIPINGGAKTRTILTKEVLKSQPIRVK